MTATPEAAWSWLENGVAARARGRATTACAWSYDADRSVARSRSPPACEPSTSRSTARSCSTTAVATRVDADEVRAKAAEQAARLPPAADDRLMAAPVALLPPGRPPAPRGDALRAVRGGSAGSRPCGRPRAGSCARRRCRMAAFGAVDRAHQARLAASSSMWTRNPALLAATFSTLDDLAPGRVILGIGAWWDPLAAEGRRRSRAGRSRRCARSSRPRARPARERDRHVRRRVRAPRRRRARLRAPGAPAEGRADLHRRDGHADDGARGRDRRRRASSTTSCRPRTTRRALDASRRGRGARPAATSTTSTGRSSSCARSTTTASAALDAARLLVTQYLGQQPHIMKASGVPEPAARRDRQGAHVARDARAGRRRVEARARRRRADDHRARARPTSAGRRSPSTSPPDARARSSTRWATTSRLMIDAFADWEAK